jgi:hypothetical protein
MKIEFPLKTWGKTSFAPKDENEESFFIIPDTLCI